jgi:hypothetical protein
MIALLFLLPQKFENFEEPEIFTGSQGISFVKKQGPKNNHNATEGTLPD